LYEEMYKKEEMYTNDEMYTKEEMYSEEMYVKGCIQRCTLQRCIHKEGHIKKKGFV